MHPGLTPSLLYTSLKTYFALKGRDNIAQGRARRRPGMSRTTKPTSPEGAKQLTVPIMSQSLVKNLVHLVYSTKHRMKWIPESVQTNLWAYQAGIFNEWNCPAIIVGGIDDHVHSLFSLSKNHALKTIVEEVKKGSSKWMKTSDGTGNQGFAWQGGYGAFSVSCSNVEVVKKYIETQADHHRKMTFQDELRSLFRKHGVEFDERYLWD